MIFPIIKMVELGIRYKKEKEKREKQKIPRYKLEKLTNGEYRFPLDEKYWFQGRMEEDYWSGPVKIGWEYREYYGATLIEKRDAFDWYYEGGWYNGSIHGQGTLETFPRYGLYSPIKALHSKKYHIDTYKHFEQKLAGVFWTKMDIYIGEFQDGLPNGYGIVFKKKYGTKDIYFFHEGNFLDALPQEEYDYELMTSDNPYLEKNRMDIKSIIC